MTPITHHRSAVNHPTNAAAQVIAASLAGNRAHLSAIGHGIFGLQHTTVGALNPALVAAFAAALSPYQGAMVGLGDEVRHFGTLMTDKPDDYSRVVSVFAVIATDQAAGERFTSSGYDHVTTAVQRIAADGCNNPEAARASEPYLRQAGGLAGSIFVAIEESGIALPAKGLGESNNAATLTIANECLAQATEAPPDYLQRYLAGAQLLQPDEIRQKLGEEALTEYYNSLESYISDKDFDLRAYYDGFQRAARLE